MSLRQTIFAGTVVLLIVAVGCGSGGGYNPNNVTVTVTPASATVAANGQVTLHAAVNGFCSTCTPQITWSVTENSVNCTWADRNTPPAGPCPGGTIQGQDAGGPLSQDVIYFAPSTTGTFHVFASQLVTLSMNVQGESIVTVGP
jgi:hypothetical protein